MTAVLRCLWWIACSTRWWAKDWGLPSFCLFFHECQCQWRALQWDSQAVYLHSKNNINISECVAHTLQVAPTSLQQRNYGMTNQGLICDLFQLQLLWNGVFEPVILIVPHTFFDKKCYKNARSTYSLFLTIFCLYFFTFTFCPWTAWGEKVSLCLFREKKKYNCSCYWAKVCNSRAGMQGWSRQVPS